MTARATRINIAIAIIATPTPVPTHTGGHQHPIGPMCGGAPTGEMCGK